MEEANDVSYQSVNALVSGHPSTCIALETCFILHIPTLMSENFPYGEPWRFQARLNFSMPSAGQYFIVVVRLLLRQLVLFDRLNMAQLSSPLKRAAQYIGRRRSFVHR